MFNYSLIKVMLITYLVYALITSVVFFYFHRPKRPNNISKKRHENHEGHSPDRVVLVQDRFQSLATRIQLLDEAEKTIDISYYGIHNGHSSDLFIANILKAADRGIKIRFLYDGLINLPRLDMQKNAVLFRLHPNIEIRCYEPFCIKRPWSWHNRLHDKIILIDNKFALIGGRNIGDKYFAKESRHRLSNDRDVLIINTNPDSIKNSVIHEIQTYFNKVWHHPFTKNVVKRPRFFQQIIAKKRRSELARVYTRAKKLQPELFQRQNWYARSYPIKRVAFIYNPLERWNKWPVVWHKLVQLLKKAKKSVFIQSPYVLPTKRMLKDWPEKLDAKITLLTNSLSASPNLIAYSVYYTKHRKNIPRFGIKLYEFLSTKESLHTKTWIFDRKITAIGSFNIDARSAFLNTEIMLIIESEAFAEHVIKETEKYLEKSLRVQHDGTYGKNACVTQGNVIKKWITILFSFFTRPIAFLL